MKVRFLSMSLVAVAAGLFNFSNIHAAQPFTGCWHPEDIKEWSPATDPDAVFNRSTVPLATRMTEPQLMRANKNQFYEGQICNATILFDRCGSSPSQGANNFAAYQPGFWQYMDKVVYWAGSASEGIICPPPAYSIDAAHLNGVKILGNLFFPPKAYGGQTAWVDEMLTKENGRYPYARKLYEIAKYFGFDGWFINEETYGGKRDFVGFIEDFYAWAEADGNYSMEIQWYDAKQRVDTEMLKTNINTSQFLEYGAVGDYRSYAADLGCTEAQTFSKIYAGVQCVFAGLTGYNSYLNQAFPTTGHVGSIDLFCPEEHIWKTTVSSLLGTPDACGDKAYAAQKQVFDNELTMWVNNARNPSDISDRRWRGISGAVLERSVITSMPFESSFCTGLGKHRFVDGEIAGTQDWWNTGVQSLLPTWRWWLENPGNTTISVDWDNAWQLGSSYRILGELEPGHHLLRLYKTMIPLTEDAMLRIVYKGVHPELTPVLATESSVTEGQLFLSEDNINQYEINGWTIREYDLSSLKGETVYMIALDINNGAQNKFYTNLNLGQIALLPKEYNPGPVYIERLEAEGDMQSETGSIRVSWDADYNADLEHFDIYLTDGNGRRLVGQTRGHGFYIPNIARVDNEASVSIEVQSIMKGGSHSAPATKSIDWPEAQTPTINLSLSRSYAEVGEDITLTANATGAPTSYLWTVPATLQIQQGQGTNSITVKCLSAGTQTLKIEATNNVGTTTSSFNAIDVYEQGGSAAVQNVSLKKTVVDYSSSSNNVETPDWLLDGDAKPRSTSHKWCTVGTADNWAIIDLGQQYRIYGFKLYDCKAGPESYENVPNLRIQVSDNGTDWQTVVDTRGRAGENIKEDYIVPAEARYVRLNPWSDEPFTMRLWEFEVFGIDSFDSIGDIVSDNVRVYPSVLQPGEPLTIQGAKGNELAIYDMQGVEIYHILLTDDTTTVHPNLSPGVYLLSVADKICRLIVK